MIDWMRYDELVKLPYESGRAGGYYEILGPLSRRSLGDPISYYQCDVLGGCGCGCPDENVRYVRDALALVAEKCPDGADWKIWYAEHRKKTDALFGNQAAEYFMWYWLAENELTEHGGSVPGWLEQRGQDLLEDLTKALAWTPPPKEG